jgi:sugar transferase (PEP-CTERM system associated)
MIRVFNQYVSTKALLLMMSEAILIVTSLIAAAMLRASASTLDVGALALAPNIAFQITLVLVILQICFYYNDLYAPRALCNRGEHMRRFLQSVGVACLMMAFLNCLAPCIAPSIFMDRTVFVVTVALLVCWGSVVHVAVDCAWRSAAKVYGVAVIGTGDIALAVLREFEKRPDLKIDIAGCISCEETGGDSVQNVLGHPVLGTLNEINRLIVRHKLSRIVVALEDQRGILPVRTLVNLRIRGIRIEDAHTTISNLTGRVWLRSIRPSWFIYSDGFRRPKITSIAKRLLDICLSFVGLVFSAPIMLVTAVFVRLESPGPILYSQERVGFAGETFHVVKFRSMRVDAEVNGGAQWASENDPRITRVGRFIRKYRIDELPQLWNVFRGEMSFVGPRPERPVFVDKLRELIPYYEERHSVRPGLTGWAQVRYEYGASVEDAVRKLEYDLFYLQNMSIMFDFAILAQTVQTVLFRKGAR